MYRLAWEDPLNYICRYSYSHCYSDHEWMLEWDVHHELHHRDLKSHTHGDCLLEWSEDDGAGAVWALPSIGSHTQTTVPKETPWFWIGVEILALYALHQHEKMPRIHAYRNGWLVLPWLTLHQTRWSMSECMHRFIQSWPRCTIALAGWSHDRWLTCDMSVPHLAEHIGCAKIWLFLYFWAKIRNQAPKMPYDYLSQQIVEAIFTQNSVYMVKYGFWAKCHAKSHVVMWSPDPTLAENGKGDRTL